ncbi:MAG: DUF72 domain-containing protein [Candidatus Methanoperedens sp.]|nr:MAG: DUF72 domain-containing protein [Candidatus Methanoperedens sp.]
MSMLYTGAGGWAYFKVPGLDSLAVYSKAFDFVEVNSTFYTTLSMEMVRSWRQRVPHNFMFSVRCHKDLTQKYSGFALICRFWRCGAGMGGTREGS